MKRPWPERRKYVPAGSRIAVLAISVWPGAFYVTLLWSVRDGLITSD